jgi:hypothetical protein
MLRKLSMAAVAAAVLAFLPGPVRAQSLGEAAAKEKAKKQQQQKKPPKVITEEDLRTAGGRGTVSVAPEPAAGAEAAKPADAAAAAGDQKAAAKPEPTEEEKRAAEEKEWRDKLKTAQDEVARLKTQVDQIQTNLNDPNLSYYGTGRPALMARMEEVKKQLATAEQAMSDLQDTGRRRAFRQ